MSKPEITTGDDVVLMHELTKYDKLTKKQVTFNIPTTSIVTSRLIALDHSEVYSSEVAQINTTTGADWSNSLVAVVFDEAITNEILSKSVEWNKGKIPAKLETQVDDNGKTTFFASLIIVKGSIE